mgnify:CR=1 FL=1
MVDVKEEKKAVPTLRDAVVKISDLLLKKPTALNISLVKEEDEHTYRWLENGDVARRIRREAREILLDLWQHGGAFNYQQLADALRVDVLAIRALLDEWMRSQYPHL